MSEAAVISRNSVNANSPSAGAVLIVDDEAEIRESLETLLEDEGYEVFNAQDGEEGLNLLDTHAFDLILLDFQLPDRNGLEILKDIRERDPEMAVIMITAYGTPENAVAAHKGRRGQLHRQAVDE